MYVCMYVLRYRPTATWNGFWGHVFGFIYIVSSVSGTGSNNSLLSIWSKGVTVNPLFQNNSLHGLNGVGPGGVAT